MTRSPLRVLKVSAMRRGARWTFILVTGASFVLLVLLQLPAVWTPEDDVTAYSAAPTSADICDAIQPTTVTTTLDPSGAIHSTCSRQATARGPGQRVVSFNFYGQKNAFRRYFQGIAANAALVSQLYPGWTMRLYHDLDPEDPDLSNLTASFPHLDLCDVRSIPLLGSLQDKQRNAWRFLPVCDPMVDVFLSRDLDSRVSLRERAAVDEWLVSGLRVHVMRDHPWHDVPVQAGMWGARLQDAASPRRLCRQLTQAPAGALSRDQDILKRELWPEYEQDVLQHDAYTCARFNATHGHARPWPTKRPDTTMNFVGSRDGVDWKPLNDTCPPECRPPQHRDDWLYC